MTSLSTALIKTRNERTTSTILEVQDLFADIILVKQLNRISKLLKNMPKTLNTYFKYLYNIKVKPYSQ